MCIYFLIQFNISVCTSVPYINGLNFAFYIIVGTRWGAVEPVEVLCFMNNPYCIYILR